MSRTVRRSGLAGVAALALGALLFFLLGGFNGDAEQIRGLRAGNLDGGTGDGVAVPVRRGGSEMIGLTEVKNVGHSPILIESVEPQSTSSKLQATAGRIWFKHLRKNEEGLPAWWPGWPPKNLPRRDGRFGWIPHPDYLALPTTATIQPGEVARLVYGIFLHADPSPDIKVTGVRITFKQDGRTIVWTYPETVNVYKPHR